EKEIQSVLPLIAKGHAPPERLKDVRIDVKVDPDRVKALATVKLLADAWQLCNQSWTILLNETKFEFITSDNPSSVIGGTVARILPISPRLGISTIMDPSKRLTRDLTRDDLNAPPQGVVTYHRIVPDGVKLANRLIAANADNLVFSR